ncbi:MAG: Hsp70 family protein, partial [Cutibacterium sp.]|nr:Hsp70 family protein [Cutibacterium sp.]
EMRNEADALAFRTEKLLEENGDKIPEDTKAPVTESIDKLKEALKGTDNDDEIKAAMEDLNQKASAMGQAIYAAAQQEAQTSEQAPADNAGDDGDTVVDAEIVDDENDSDK